MHLLTPDDVAQLKRRYTDPHFADAVAKLQKTATHEMNRPLYVPTEGAGWTHNYTCPTHATRLRFDRDKPHEHVCEIDGEVFSGGLYDAAWRGFRNHRLIGSAYAAAVLWVMSGDMAFQQHARAILTAYAQNYPDYPVHGINAGQGRVMGQSLDEAVWSIPAAWTFDLIRDSLSAEEEIFIRERLLHGLGDHLLTQLWTRIHNIQCWHLAGLATIGVVLDEDRYLQPVFEAQWGFAAQIEQGVMADGWWWEGSPHYHFYTLQAITSLGMAVRYRHPELLDNPRLKKMFSAPVEMLRADFSLPAFNDGWYNITETGGLAESQYVKVYERAYGFWQEPLYLQVMTHIYSRYTKRDEVDALLFGAETLPEPLPMPAASVVQATSGYAILKSSDNQRQLILKYGQHGGGHGHPDKLALDLWAYGQRLSPDLGTPGYGIAMNNSWYRHTLSHNTVLLDSTNQLELTGELLRFEQTDTHTLVEAVANFPASEDAVWSDVRLRRVILWKDAYFIDVVLVNCSQAHTIDLAWHHTGALSLEGLAAVSVVFEQNGYAHLKNIRSTDATQWHAQWHNPATAMWAFNPVGTITYATDAPGNPTSDVMSLILRRVVSDRAVFISVIEPFAATPTITRVEWVQTADDLQVSVQGSNFSDHWHLDTVNGIYQQVTHDS